MNGVVILNTVEELAKFLKEFTGSTATFKAQQTMDGRWIIEFDGGY